jgi:hypothetical protein
MLFNQSDFRPDHISNNPFFGFERPVTGPRDFLERCMKEKL